MSIIKKEKAFLDPSLWLLLAINVGMAYYAIVENWNLIAIMAVYWMQSVTIGIFNFIRILELEEFSTKGFKINERRPKATKGTKFFTAFFFLAHYGGFHLVYLIFIFASTFSSNMMKAGGGIVWSHVILAGVFFFANHLFSYLYNRRRDSGKQNIGIVMMYPYARILPMHFTIILGSFAGAVGLPLFLGLKTVADVIMHYFEHVKLRKGILIEDK